MANPPVRTQFAMPDPNAAPLNLAQLFTLANALVSSEIVGSSFNTYVIQNGTPGVGDQGKVWIELSSDNKPLAIKTFFNGHWRKVYSGSIGEVKMFSGDPTNKFDAHGKGIIGGEWDGWHICNGKDGVIDLSDKFVIAAHLNDKDNQVGWNASDNVWQTFVDGKAVHDKGGSKDFTMNADNTFDDREDLIVGRLKIDTGGEDYDAGGLLYGKPGGSTVNKTILAAPLNSHGDPRTNPDPVPCIPPYFALAFVVFIGY